MKSTTIDETETQSSPNKREPSSAFMPKDTKAAERERQKNKGLDRRKRNGTSKQPTVIIYDEHKGITAYDRYGWKRWGTDVRPSSEWLGDTPIASEFADNGVITCAYQSSIFGINARDGSIAWKTELPKKDCFETVKSVFQNEKYALILTKPGILRHYPPGTNENGVKALSLTDGKECWNATDLNDVMAITENYAVLSGKWRRTAEMVSLKTGKETGKVNFGNYSPTAFCAEGKTIAYAPAVNVERPTEGVNVHAKTCLLDESGKTLDTTVEDRKGGTINLLSLSKNAELLATATKYRDERCVDAEKDEYVITVYSKNDAKQQDKEYSRVWSEHASGPVLGLKFDPENEHLIATTQLTETELRRYQYTVDLITSYDPCKGKKQWEHRCNKKYTNRETEDMKSERMNGPVMALSHDGLVYVGSGALGAYERSGTPGFCALNINDGQQMEQIRIEPAVKKQGGPMYLATNVKSIAVRKTHTVYGGGGGSGG